VRRRRQLRGGDRVSGPGVPRRRAPGGRLRGRDIESAALDRLVAAGREGRSAVLVVHGDPGVGKTALLDQAVRTASDFRVLHASGVESDMELAFAALHQLCAPLLGGVQGLPGPQRSALDTVFGTQPGPPPDRFLVGLAVLNLLSEASGETPLLCVVDDVQWLDRASAQVFGFVARRLMAESVVFLFGTRELGRELADLPELEVTGLRDVDARALLAPVFRYVLDDSTRSRILAEARGNPLALLELPRGPAVEELTGRFGAVTEQPLSRHLEDSFLARVEELPDEDRLLLLLAAAEPVGDAALLWQAAGRLGLDADIATGREFKALLTIDDRVIFRHPLVRSAVYRGATMADRRRVHLALSAVTNQQVDPDRRAWHLASAAVRPDESVAAELERCAGRAQARGGLAAAAALLQRSVALTEEVSLRVGRALSAAQVSLQAGEFDLSARMVVVAEAGTMEETELARAMLLRGQTAFASGHSRDAIRALLSAARTLQTLDPTVARETYLEAWGAAVVAGEAGEDTDLSAVSAAATSLSPAEEPGPPEILLDGLVALTTSGRVAAAPILRRAMAAFASVDTTLEDNLRWGWMMGNAPSLLWDEQTWQAINVRQIDLMRSVGALARLPLPLSSTAIVLALRGDFALAATALAEVDAVVEVTGTQIAPFGAVVMAALRGREEEASALLDSVAERAAGFGQGFGVQFTRWASAILLNGLGHYEQAFLAAQRASAEAPELFISAWALPELIEASVRTERIPVAEDALDRLSVVAAAGDTDWVRGVEARSRALVSDDDMAERFYQEAVERLGRTTLRPELARARLLYGEWLRRQSRRMDARVELRAAHDLFVAIGMEAFAERSRRELMATGETVRKRTAEASASDALTPQERQIALLVRDGLSNPEIGARLFLSPRTVEWHLRKIFTKFSITSRKQLRDSLQGSARTATAARPSTLEE
jgi:DNA-binding CsgD family transcriptional regulator/tetratricopeptide (TPR) repeat protein